MNCKITLEWSDGQKREYTTADGIDSKLFNFEATHPSLAETMIVKSGKRPNETYGRTSPKIIIGEYSITQRGNFVWFEHNGGEGMQLTEATLAEMFKEFM